MGITSFIKKLLAPAHKNESNIENIQSHKKYSDILSSSLPETYLKNLSGHNMSYDIYKVKATYKQTNRARTVQIYAWSEEDAVSQLDDALYILPPQSIVKDKYQPPSKEQISYAISLGLNLPKKCCKEDATALISIHLDHFNAPQISAELMQFALSKRISFSMYLDEPHLIGYIYSSLHKNPDEQTALMVACMYKKQKKKWDFSNWEEWCRFGAECQSNPSFVRSLVRRSNSSDQMYGEFYGFEYNAPSHRTVIYQTISNYLE